MASDAKPRKAKAGKAAAPEGTEVAAEASRPFGRLAAAAAPYLYVTPMVLLVGVFLLYPAADTMWLSLTKWNGIYPPTFIGFDSKSEQAAKPRHRAARAGRRTRSVPGRKSALR